MRHLLLIVVLFASCATDGTPSDLCPSGQAPDPVTGACEMAARDMARSDAMNDEQPDSRAPADMAPRRDVGADAREADAACAPTEVCGMCPDVAVPAAVAAAPLGAEAQPGRYETVNAGGFRDDYIYNAADTFKIGTRREWGGTVIFFGISNGQPGGNPTNVIDANDTGREVQVAFYDPDRRLQNCAWNASCATVASQCETSITYLGWNPVQGGNRCNNGSGVESVEANGGALTVTTLPLHWNPNWDRQDCSSVACNDASLNTRRADVRVVQRLRFVREHVVELDYVVTNLAALNHAPTAQEFPTIYTANGQSGPDLWRLFDSAGTEVVINQPANDGFMWKPFASAGGWVTMQNQTLDYGVGHYTENRLTDWQGWQLRSLPFNNFRPVFDFGIPANGTVRARSYLILGGQGTVAAEAAWLDQNLSPFGVADEPAADAVVGDTMTVRGWALDNKSVTAVEAIIDGGAPTLLAYGSARPDVCVVWPRYPGCGTGAVGYSGEVDLSRWSQCAHLLEVVATDSDGNRRVIARRRFTRGMP